MSHEDRQAVHVVFQPDRLFRAALLIGVLTIAPWMLAKAPQLHSHPEYQVAAQRIHFTSPTGGVPSHLLDQVIERSELPAQLELLDSNVNQRVAEAFARHPWVKRVVQVRKTFPSRIEVDLEYRVPAAVVQFSQAAFPIDEHAVLLPTRDFTPEALAQLPVIRNVAEAPVGGPGRLWRDASVQGGAQLAAALKPHWNDWKLEAIVAPRPTSRTSELSGLMYHLATAGGSRIVWGRAPGVTHPGELTVAQKLGRMEKYVREFGGFDVAHSRYEIDIRHWQEISRKRLQLAEEPRARRGSSATR